MKPCKYNSCVASTSHLPFFQSYSDPVRDNVSKCDSSLHNHLPLHDSVIPKDADKSIEFSIGHLSSQWPQPESSPRSQTYPLSRSLEPCLKTSSKSSEVTSPGLPLPLPVAKLPWMHSQANLSASPTVAMPGDVIQTVAIPNETIQTVAAPGDAAQSVTASSMLVQPMPIELPAFSYSGLSITWPHPTSLTGLRGSIHPLDKLPHSTRWGFQSFFQGSLYSAYISAVRLDPCDMSSANQPDLVDTRTSAQSDGPVWDVQLVFEGPGAPPQRGGGCHHLVPLFLIPAPGVGCCFFPVCVHLLAD